MTDWFEILRDGEPTSYLFLSKENAQLWINTHGTDGASYSIREYKE